MDRADRLLSPAFPRGLALGLGLALVLGCAMTPPQEVVWMRQDIKGLQDQVRTLRSQVANPENTAQLRNIEEQQRRNQQRLADRMVEIELQLSELAKQMRRVQEASEQSLHGEATTGQQITRLEARATALEGALQEVSAQLQQARSEQRQAIEQLAKPAPPPAPKAKPAAKPEAKKPAPEAKPTPQPTPPAAEAAASAPPEVKAAYEAALKEIRSGDRQAGLAAMEALVKDHPHSDLTDNAYYWIGEGYYAAGQFESAILKFDDLLIRFPASDKVAGALLKTGMAFAALAEQGDRKENLADAKLAFSQVIQRFPDSDEAKIARQQLARVAGQ